MSQKATTTPPVADATTTVDVEKLQADLLAANTAKEKAEADLAKAVEDHSKEIAAMKDKLNAAKVAKPAGGEKPSGKKLLYVLGSKFWNGKAIEQAGAERYFVEGEQPRDAVLAKPKAETEDKK